MVADSIERLRAACAMSRIFRNKGIIFKDITPILVDSALFRDSIECFLERCRALDVDEGGRDRCARVSFRLGGRLCARGRLRPDAEERETAFKTESAAYSLEYGDAEVEMHVDSIEPGEKIVLIDDLLATGGTSAAAAALIRKAGGDLLEAQFLIELEFLDGRPRLDPTPVVSFLKF